MKENVFVFGGQEYIVQDRYVLKGMTYYRVLQSKITGNKIYLICFPGDNLV